MLAGCSSTLLSPRHRLRSEAAAQFQACNFPSMSTQRLDLPRSFPRKDSSRAQSVRPVGISLEKSIETRTSTCSLKHTVQRERKDEQLWEGSSRNLKRLAEQTSYYEEENEDESCMNRAKRKRGCAKSDNFQGDLSLCQLGSGNFWFKPSFESVPSHPFSISSCSGEEEYLAPSNVMRNNPWLNSIVAEITDIGDRKNLETSQRPVKEASSGSSTSSATPSFDLAQNSEDVSEHVIKNGSGPPRPNQTSDLLIVGNNNQRGEEEEVGFELISLLSACLEAISSKNIPGINHFIAKLGDLASPRGSTISRLTAYYTEALALRVSRLWPHIFHITTPRELHHGEDESGTALRLLNQVTPIPKFIHFTANEIFLRAFEGKDRIHIIDFDIKQGLQWPSFFQSLSSRSNPPSHVRITGIGESKQELIETGERLSGFAEALNLPFEFHPVVDRLEDVRLWMLHVKDGESVAVNCISQLHKMLYDGTFGAFRDFSGLIRSTNPVVVVVAEQESEHNDPILESRVSNSLKYYSAIFDSVDSVLPLESPARIKIEESFAREIRNVIACEGRDRFERHIGFHQWKKLMEQQGGFKNKGITEREFHQSQMLLKMYPFCESYYRVKKQGQDGLTLSWLDQPLYTVSAWIPSEVAGSSSSYQQPN